MDHYIIEFAYRIFNVGNFDDIADESVESENNQHQTDIVVTSDKGSS